MEERVQEVTTVNAAGVPGQVVTKSTSVEPAVVTEHPQQVYQKKKTIFRAYQVIWYILALIEVALGFRMAFKALGANPYSGFVSLIYTFTEPLVLPFRGILRTPILGNSVFEWSTVIAAIVYALIAYGIVHIMQLVKPVSPLEVSEKVDNPT